nr:dual specificity protein kinase Ttk [Hymenolepis microstoma]
MRMFKRQADILTPPSLQAIAESETEEENLTLSIKTPQVITHRLQPIEESTVQMESVMAIEENEPSCVVMSPRQIMVVPEGRDEKVKEAESERIKEIERPRVTRKWPFWGLKETGLLFRGVRDDEIDKENTYVTLPKPNRTSGQDKSAPLTQKTIVPNLLPSTAVSKVEENVKIEQPPPVNIKKSPQPLLPPLTINNSNKGDVNNKDPISLLIEQSNAIVGGEKFLLLRKIGRGGFSSVYCVMNHDRQMRAIKRIELSQDSKEVLPLFQNEIDLLTSLRDTNRVINLFKYEITRSELVMVLEYAEQDLKAHLKMRRESGALSNQFMVFIWSEMLACVKVIHDRRIIHLDLKPENFVIVNGMLKLIDLGISQRLPMDCTHMDLQKPMGSLIYMSPEQLISVLKGQAPEIVPGQESKMRLRTDVWALGAILFEILHGKSLYGRINQTAVIAAIISPTPIDFPPVENPILDTSLKRSLVREVDKRATVDELIYICSRCP